MLVTYLNGREVAVGDEINYVGYCYEPADIIGPAHEPWCDCDVSLDGKFGVVIADHRARGGSVQAEVNSDVLAINPDAWLVIGDS